MEKAICFKNVLPGDVVCKEVGRTRRVGAVSAERDPYVELFFGEGGFTKGRPEELIGLVHRPWPERKTEQDMLAVVGKIARDLGLIIGDAQRQQVVGYRERDLLQAYARLPELREALDAYELGRPTDEEVKRARGFIDKHMTP